MRPQCSDEVCCRQRHWITTVLFQLLICLYICLSFCDVIVGASPARSTQRGSSRLPVSSLASTNQAAGAKGQAAAAAAAKAQAAKVAAQAKAAAAAAAKAKAKAQAQAKAKGKVPAKAQTGKVKNPRVKATPSPAVSKKVKNPPSTVPKVAPKVTPKVAPKVAPKVSPKGGPKSPPVPKVAPKVTPKAAPKQPSPKAAPNTGAKVTPRPVPKSPASAPKPPAPDNSVFTGTPSAQQTDVAVKRINFFLNIMKMKGFSTFVDLFVSTGLNETMVTLLPFFSCTFMIPSNAAFTQVSKPDLELINAKKDGWLQVMAFHVWFPAYLGDDLIKAPPGTEYSTADYPVKGIRAYKLRLDKPTFDGRKNDERGANLTQNSIYYDKTSPLMIAHALDKVMVPIKFF